MVVAGILVLLLAVTVSISYAMWPFRKQAFEMIGEPPKKVALLLTAAIHPPKVDDLAIVEMRRSFYERALKFYLEKTELPVLVVESTGIGFPNFDNPRLKQHVFKIAKDHGTITLMEVESLQAAYAANLFAGCRLVIKVTGKYVLPTLEEQLSKVPEDVEIVYQHARATNRQNSEVFGFAPRLFTQLFSDECFQAKDMEDCIFGAHLRLDVRAYDLDPLPIAEPVARSDGSVMPML